jgi:hypothetical protein
VVPYVLKHRKIRDANVWVPVVIFDFEEQGFFYGPLKNAVGRTVFPLLDPTEEYPLPIICIDSRLPKGYQEWVIRHEVVHAEDWFRVCAQVSGEIDRQALVQKLKLGDIWDEMKAELLALRDFDPSLFRTDQLPWQSWESHVDLLLPLKRYMRARDGREQAERLIQFLKEEIENARKERKSKGSAPVPESPIS